ncbi:MAG: hypothetical protein U0103_23265 [Candidatus Obscuribacterales bacterium]
MLSVRSQAKPDGAVEFGLGFFAIALAAAAMSGCAPIGFSVATVFLFAGPHNWIEARYFLSRLPARFGKFKQFFLWSFCGIALLTGCYIALMAAVQLKVLTGTAYSALLGAWDAAFVLWCVRLIVLSGRWRFSSGSGPASPGSHLQGANSPGLALPFGLLAISFALVFPAWFSLGLVYLHPLIGCWILDRELQRSKPSWRPIYHLCLSTVPLFLAAIWWTLHDAPPLGAVDLLTSQITKHAGSQVMPYASSHMLVALHTFLEMVHYGVWLIAIPLVSAGWRNWQPGSIPIAHRSDQLRHMVPAIFVLFPLCSLCVVGLFRAELFRYQRCILHTGDGACSS